MSNTIKVHWINFINYILTLFFLLWSMIKTLELLWASILNIKDNDWAVSMWHSLQFFLKPKLYLYNNIFPYIA